MGSTAGYDYIIVGAGSAGCVLANRLTEDDGATVLLLEAGGQDRHPYIQIPLGLGKLRQHRMFDWGYTTEPEPHLNGRRLHIFRRQGTGRIILDQRHGLHPRPPRRLRSLGARRRHRLVLCRRVALFQTQRNLGGRGNPWRGGSGPLGTQWAQMQDPIVDAWHEAGRLAGWPTTPDINGADGMGFGRSQFTIKDGRRASASNAYLRPALQRPGLTLRTGAQVLRVTLQGTRATGVDFARNGRTEHAEAKREIILCGGVFNSPQLLMLSGSARRISCANLGIRALADLPVGRNLRDHLAVALIWNRIEPGPFHRQLRLDRAAINMTRALLFRAGPATTLPLGEIAFVKSRPDLEAPDIDSYWQCARSNAAMVPWFAGSISGRHGHPARAAASA